MLSCMMFHHLNLYSSSKSTSNWILQTIGMGFSPNIAYGTKIMCMQAISSVECEHCISNLHFLKTYLCSAMSEVRLSGLVSVYWPSCGTVLQTPTSSTLFFYHRASCDWQLALCLISVEPFYCSKFWAKVWYECKTWYIYPVLDHSWCNRGS